MPYRVRFIEGSAAQYLDKHGSWTLDIKKARIYTQLGHIKTSLGDFEDYQALEIEELELRPTGVKLTGYDVIGKHREAKQRAEREARERRSSTERLAERKRELAELERLKAKYES